MEEILANVQRKHENRVSDLQATVDRLIKVGWSRMKRFNGENSVTAYSHFTREDDVKHLS